jgi:hypothetical protein
VEMYIVGLPLVGTPQDRWEDGNVFSYGPRHGDERRPYE